MTALHVRVAALLSAGVLGAAQSPALPAFATVSAIVERRDGSFVGGLTKEDFALTCDGIARPLAFVRETDEPLTLMLLLDVTMSIEGSQWSVALSYTREGFARMVDRDLTAALRPQDRLRLGSVAASFIASPEFSRDGTQLAGAVRAALNRDLTDRLGPSPIWDATDEALGLLASEPGHRAVILFSDGQATGNRRSVTDVAREAARLGIGVHVVSMAWDLYVQQGPSTALHQRPSLGLRRLADLTGGVFLQASYGSELRSTRPEALVRADRENQTNTWLANRPGEAFRRVLAGLRHTYTIGFAQAPDGKTHDVDIQVARPGLTVRAPKSYVAQR